MRTVLLTLIGLFLAVPPVADRVQAGPAQRAEQPPVPVAAAPVVLAPVEHVVHSAGRLDAVRIYRAHSEIQGRILDLPHRPGDAVEAGGLLVRLDDTLIRAELAKAVARREQAEADLSRMERLYARRGASEDELLEARTALAVARAEERLARARLERTRLTAPFSGVVSERRAEPGDTVPPGTHLLTLIDPTRLEVALSVPDRILPRLKVGHPVELRIDGVEGRILHAPVTRIHPEVDPDTLKGTVVVTLDPVPAGARPGLLVRARLRLHDPPALHIPLAALQRTRDGTWVWRITPQGTAERVSVETGPLSGDRVVVREGLQAGDRVVVRGFVRLRPGRRVEIVEDGGS